MSLPTPSQSVSHKWFHQCVNHKKKLSLRHPLPTFGSFPFFWESLWLGVHKVLQKLTKSYKSELRDLVQCSILIPRKCPRKTPFQHTVPLPPGSDSPVSHSFFYRLRTLSNLWAVIYFILLIFLMNENISLHKKKKNILLYKKMFLRNS